MNKKIATPGTWKSWLSAEILSTTIKFSDVQFSPTGELIWSEGRSGKTVLIRKPEGDAFQELTTNEQVRGGVGYGGGEFGLSNDAVYFTTKDGRLYQRKLKGYRSKPIIPSYGKIASPIISPDGDWAVYVFSDGDVDLLGIVDTSGKLWPDKLLEGSDFYMQPVWHPNGNTLAWIEWDHPNMPWDETRLKLAKIERSPDSLPHLTQIEMIAGGENITVSQPQFSPDGRYLSYILCENEWDDLVICDLETGETRKVVEGDGSVVAKPAWVQGNHEYGWSPEGDRIYYLQIHDSFTTLWQVEVSTGQKRQIDVSPYTYLHQLTVSPKDGSVAFIASGPTVSDRIVQLVDGRLQILRRCSSENIPPGLLPIPKPIEWEASDRTNVHGLYYPPTNPDYELKNLPPVIVNIHGGPTSQQYVRYDPTIPYFTSRGYGWFEINYRGSTGYGKAYQQILYDQWGKVDVDDAVDGAKKLIDMKLADPDRLVIKGGSAGGYTVLNVLVQFPGAFAAGIDMYGVSDLFSLAVDTHKFELRYTDKLVGPLPDASERYREWSPVFHAEKIQDPVAVFQGADDVVVPPNQSEMIVEELKKNRVPYIYKLYEGEGHGFRKAETRKDLLLSIEKFLNEHVIFA
ncbi:MAG: S9 family peptidase [Anaerolineaceae bacterium]|nr:S9 family peptidase [Anaerolineaceae bacterium]